MTLAAFSAMTSLGPKNIMEEVTEQLQHTPQNNTSASLF